MGVRREKALLRRLPVSAVGRWQECAPNGGQIAGLELTGPPGFQRMKAMAKHRSNSVEFKRQQCGSRCQACI